MGGGSLTPSFKHRDTGAGAEDGKLRSSSSDSSSFDSGGVESESGSGVSDAETVWARADSG